MVFFGGHLAQQLSPSRTWFLKRAAETPGVLVTPADSRASTQKLIVARKLLLPISLVLEGGISWLLAPTVSLPSGHGRSCG